MSACTAWNHPLRVSRTLTPIGPFDFALSLGFMSSGDSHIARYESGKYWQVLRIGDKLVHSMIRSTGSVASPRLHFTLQSENTLSDDDTNTVMRCLSFMLNSNLDVEPFYWIAKNDALMTKLINQLYGLKNIQSATVFEALVCSVIEQQLSLPVARSLEHRVIRALGDSMMIRGTRYYAFPTAQQLAHCSIDTLHRCGVSRQKGGYITGIAKTVEQGEMDIEGLKQCNDTQAIVDILCTLRGVGLWTAELTALRGLNRLDVIPVANAGLERRWIVHYYCRDHVTTAKQMRQIAARWDKWKGLAGYYLITAGRLGVGL